MAHMYQPASTKNYTRTIIISIIALYIFSFLMMQWHGSYIKDAQGNIHYNTRVNDPRTGY